MNKTDFSGLKHIAPQAYLSVRHAEIGRARSEIAEARAEIERSVMVLKGVPRKHLRFITIAIAGYRIGLDQWDGENLARWAAEEAVSFQNNFKRIAKSTGRVSRDAGDTRFVASIEMDLVRPSDGGRKAALMALLNASPLLTERAVLLHAHVVFSGEGHDDIRDFAEVIRRAYPGNHSVFCQSLYKERTVERNLSTLAIYIAKATSERSLCYSDWAEIEMDDEDTHRPAQSFRPVEPFFASLVAQAQVHLVREKVWTFTNIRSQKKGLDINNLCDHKNGISRSPSLTGTSCEESTKKSHLSYSPSQPLENVLDNMSKDMMGESEGGQCQPNQAGTLLDRLRAEMATGKDLGHATWVVQQEDTAAAHRSAVLMGLKKPSPVPAALLKADRRKASTSTDERRQRRSKRLPRSVRRKNQRDAARDTARLIYIRERMADLHDIMEHTALAGFPTHRFDEIDYDARDAYESAAEEFSALHYELLDAHPASDEQITASNDF